MSAGILRKGCADNGKIGLPFEIIAVDDGSRDKSLEIISEHCKKDKRLKCVSFSRNFGQQAAFFCGLENCSGDAAILIDADLQDPPEIFPEMIAKWREGYDVVHGVRRVRKRNLSSKSVVRDVDKFNPQTFRPRHS